MRVCFDWHVVSLLRLMAILCSAILTGGQCRSLAGTADLAVVPLYDGRGTELLNTWGGAWSVGNAKGASLQYRAISSAEGSLCLELGPVKLGEDRYLQCLASGFGPAREYQQTRDLTPYARLDFRVRNMTRVPLRGVVQLKDYRDSLQHCAAYEFQVASGTAWAGISVPLRLADAGWRSSGQPDLSRILTIDFRFAPQIALTSGQIYLTDVALTERGSPIDIDASPLASLVERLACRQWRALWAARNPPRHAEPERPPQQFLMYGGRLSQKCRCPLPESETICGSGGGQGRCLRANSAE
jgi:hypothetical protein